MHIPASGSSAVVLRGAAPPGFVAGGHGDEVGDRLAGFGAQPEDGAELLGVDARVADHGQQLDLLLQQAGLLLVELGEEERGRHAEGRSEEHTSELQSLAYLVCRLLLEKKKT